MIRQVVLWLDPIRKNLLALQGGFFYVLVSVKLGTIGSAIEKRAQVRKLGGKFVLTNGCFDILHAGHVFSLMQASKKGYLCVAINSDHSVRTLKGYTRPIQEEGWRQMVVNALKPVSCTFIFNTPRLDKEIRLLAPDIYVKAGDYNVDSLHPSEREALEDVGAKIEFTGTIIGLSTTNIIDKIKL